MSISKIFIVFVFCLSVGSVYAEAKNQQVSENPVVTKSGETLEVPEIDDSKLQKIVRQVLRSLDRAVEGSVVNTRRFFRLINNLFRTVGEYFGMIDRQIQSSNCINRSCSEYGVRD